MFAVAFQFYHPVQEALRAHDHRESRSASVQQMNDKPDMLRNMDAVALKKRNKL